MHFALISPVVAVALSLISPVLGAESIYPPGGPGIVQITISGQSESTGCLDADGKWTVADSCAEVYGNGQGGLAGPNGWYILDADSKITTTTTTWSTAWVGTHIDQARTTFNLQANIGSTSKPSGGPWWFASNVPADVNVVDLSGLDFTTSENVTLTFVSTFVESRKAAFRA